MICRGNVAVGTWLLALAACSFALATNTEADAKDGVNKLHSSHVPSSVSRPTGGTKFDEPPSLIKRHLPRTDDPSPRLRPARRDTVSISGFSSGGFAAVQAAVAFSSVFRGVGVIAGGPYNCSRGKGFKASFNCNDSIPTSVYTAGIQHAENAGLIDNINNLRNRTYVLFTGANDTWVPTPALKALIAELNVFDVNPARMHVETSVPAEHSWVTSNFGTECGTLNWPFITNCNYDFAQRMLRHTIEEQQHDAPHVRWNATKGSANATARLFSFNQTVFGADSATNSLADSGWAYIPKRCEASATGPLSRLPCHVHIVLHGCGQCAEVVGDELARHSEMNGWAESNGAIVVYPQVVSNLWLGNAVCCWDFWGYSGASTYLFKAGPQVAFFERIVRHLVAGLPLI